MDIKKGHKLYTIFLRYLVSFCVLSIILIFSLIRVNINLNMWIKSNEPRTI